MKNTALLINESNSAVGRLTWMAAFASALIAVSLPTGYFVAAYYYERGALEAEVLTDAFFVSRVAAENPVLWEYQQLRLQDILDRRPRSGLPEVRSVLASDGRLIAESADAVGRPLMMESAPVLDSGRPVGTVTVARSLRPLLANTLLAALVSTVAGGVIFYTIRILPIRSVQRAEESLRQSARELEETNADLQSFIFSLSHDLRTPLVTLKGFTGELSHALKEHEAVLKPRLRDYDEKDRMRLLETLHYEIPETLEFINMASDKMNSMINSVLKLSRVYQTIFKPQYIELEVPVRSQLARYQEAIRHRNAEVKTGILHAVTADPQAVEEIVGQLLDNAVKYLLPDRPGIVEISSERHGGETVLSIHDNGRGIAPEDLPKIFGLFRRAGRQSILGEGMGLVYVKALVRRNGGRIWCESFVGAGSVFHVALPAPMTSDRAER